MDQHSTLPPDAFHYRHRFHDRKMLMANPDQIQSLAGQILTLLESNQPGELRELIDQYYPPDLADVMDSLDDAQDQQLFDLLRTDEAADVLDELDNRTRERLIRKAEPERLAPIADALPSDEAANILGYLPASARERVLERMNSQAAESARFLLQFSPQSAGGIMSLGYTAVPENATIGQALEKFKEVSGVESIFSIFVIDENGALLGETDLRELLVTNPDHPITEMMTRTYAHTYPDADQEDVARIFARYDLNSLPVLERPPSNRLVGVITADDVIDVIEQEFTEDLLRMAGSDAAEMERRSPARTALMRLPWILATMLIELLAGFVIRFYNPTLSRVLLLASFMPIISAISGNTGLQSATIIVRGLSTGSIQASEWQRAILRQLVMTLILGGVTGLTLGIIGAIWYGKWTFGLVVALGMFLAVNIAGVVGTVVPLTSKRLGFDPAITSGPFETAFQDVVGISLFLTFATVMLRFIIK
jgi:magnesium transporter